MIKVNGRIFAKNDDEYQSIELANVGLLIGYYKIRKNGILFLNKNKDPFIFLCRNEPSSPFLVNCSCVEHNGKMKIRYMYALSSINLEILGLESFSYMQKHDLCTEIHEEPFH